MLLLVYEDFDVILTGDATFDTENTIIGRYGTWLPSEVLKVGHHGSSATSSSRTWVDAVNAEYAIISADHGQQYGHPRQDVIHRLDDHTVTVGAHPLRWWTSTTAHVDNQNYTQAVYSTANNGNIVISSDGSVTPIVQLNVP